MFEGWDEYRLIEKELRRLAEGLPLSDLGTVIDYAISSPGKRVRPLVLIFSTKAFGGTASESMKAALAVELVHAASLVHDDILDYGIERRGAPSTVERYGRDAALLCGDYLISRSIDLISGYNQPVIKAFSRACMEMSEGEMLDLSCQNTPQEYYLCISKKTASLVAASAGIGCLIAGAGEEDVAGFESYGMHLGLAYQVADDLREYTGADQGKSSQKSSVTLLAIYNKDHPPEAALKLCADTIHDHCSAAKRALASVGGEEEIKDRLDNIVDKMAMVWEDECKLLKSLC